MTPEQWQQVRAVLAEALEQKTQERAAFLERACASDPWVREEVELLLSSSEEARSSFLQSATIQITLTPGARLGDYEVRGLLGSGGMGEVYRARDTRLEREVAIKVLPAFLSHDPDRLRRFEQEARAVAALNHPNILAVFQMGTYEGAPYLVTELLEGGTLREQLGRGPLPLRKTIDCAVQIARGLAAAHEKGIVHRDLKPENLFVTKDGRVKILDFGLAKLTQPLSALKSTVSAASGGTEPGVVMGTVGYMAPEQVRGEAADPRADIFAFGAVLYEMLSGKRAFQKPTSVETLTAILNEDPAAISQLIPAVAPALQRIVHRCLEKKAEQRFQSASDLAFALEALSDSGGRPALAPVRSRRISRWVAAALVLLALAVALAAMLWLRAPGKVSDRSSWVQITNLPDAVSQPALSPDGRMLAFVRGPDTFAAPGQIYVKMLPEGEPVQLTRDNLQKMSPVFSPDGSKIAYTTVATSHWDTWAVPVISGQPQLWLPNASGLVWSGRDKILFSEIKDNDIHMAIVAAEESRAGQRDVYVPAGKRGMAHRSYPSPDGRWALVVEMDRAIWLPCRLVPLDGSSAGRQVGPPNAGCTFAAWSPDGEWMYLSSSAGGTFHIWRQRFRDGPPEQITSGPSEEEGIAMAPDGRSFITAVGMRQSAVWLQESNGERQVSLEGYSYDPKFTPDGKRLCYRILKGASPISDPGELRVVELDSGRNEGLLPGFRVVGAPGLAYDISLDGREVVVSALDPGGKPRLWVAPLDRRSPPRQVPNAEGDGPLFGPGGEIFFRAIEGTSAFVYRVHEDGSQLRRAIEQTVANIVGISQDRQWLVAKIPGTEGSRYVAFSLRGASPVTILGAKLAPSDPKLGWSPDGRWIFVSCSSVWQMAGRWTYAIPLSAGRAFPKIPAGGFQSEAEIAKLPGARRIDAYDVALGPRPEVYAFVRETVQRNLYRIPLP